MIAPADINSAGEQLTALAAGLADAEASDPPDAGKVSEVAWQILAELNEQTYARMDAEQRLEDLLTAARAAVADARDAKPDPARHLRRYLAGHGKMPPRWATSQMILAAAGNLPHRPRRRGHSPARHTAAAAQTAVSRA